MFPEEEEIVEDFSEILPGTGSVIGFDYKTCEIPVLDGRILLYDDLDAVQYWIEKQTHTVKDKYEVYKNVDFGICDLKELITAGFPEMFVRSQIESDTTERLLEHPSIKEVSEFEFEKEKRTWKVNFMVATIYGEVKEVVLL